MLVPVVFDLKVPGFKPREWVTRNVWKKRNDGAIFIAYEDVEHEDISVQSDKYVRAYVNTLYKYERLPAISGGFPRTRCTFYLHVDPRGLIPKRLVNARLGAQLIFLSDLRKKFDKSLKIDKARRKSLIPRIERMRVGGENASAAMLVEQFKDLFKEREDSEEIQTDLKLASSRIKVKRSEATAWGRTR